MLLKLCCASMLLLLPRSALAQSAEIGIRDYNNRDYSGAYFQFDEAIEETESSPKSLYIYGRTIQKMPNPRPVIPIFEKLVQKFPQSEEAKKAKLFLATGQIPQELPRLTEPMTRHFIEGSQKIIQTIIPLRRHRRPLTPLQSDTPPPGGGVFGLHFDGPELVVYDIDVLVDGKKATAIFEPDVFYKTGCCKPFLDKLGIVMNGEPTRIRHEPIPHAPQEPNPYLPPLVDYPIIESQWHISVALAIAGTGINATVPLTITTFAAQPEPNVIREIRAPGDDVFWIGSDFFKKQGEIQIDPENDELIFCQSEGFVKSP